LTNGLPAGIELEGLPGNDDQLLSIASAFETLLTPIVPPAV